MDVWLENPAEGSIGGEANGVGLTLYSNGIGYAAFIPNSKKVHIG